MISANVEQSCGFCDLIRHGREIVGPSRANGWTFIIHDSNRGLEFVTDVVKWCLVFHELPNHERK